MLLGELGHRIAKWTAPLCRRAGLQRHMVEWPTHLLQCGTIALGYYAMYQCVVSDPNDSNGWSPGASLEDCRNAVAVFFAITAVALGSMSYMFLRHKGVPLYWFVLVGLGAPLAPFLATLWHQEFFLPPSSPDYWASSRGNGSSVQIRLQSTEAG